jgi:hypothetical protein
MEQFYGTGAPVNNTYMSMSNLKNAHRQTLTILYKTALKQYKVDFKV